MKANGFVIIFLYIFTVARVPGKKISSLIQRVVKGGYRSRFTKNKSALSQFTKNNNGISRFTKKKKFFSDITYRYILKSYIQSKALFEVFTIRPLRVLGASKRKPSSEFCV